MSPILGIYASQISGHLWEPAGAYDALWSTTVPSGGVSTITISNIPQTYKHLQIRMLGRTNRTTYSSDYIKLVANNDTGANYANHQLVGTGSAASAAGTTGNTNAFIQRFSGNAIAANIFGVAVVDILDYANTNKYKTIRNLGGIDENNVAGVGEIGLYSSLWLNTSAISSITLSSGGGTLFSQYSSFALYGIN